MSSGDWIRSRSLSLLLASLAPAFILIPDKLKWLKDHREQGVQEDQPAGWIIWEEGVLQVLLLPS